MTFEFIRPEQRYVVRAAEELGIDLKVVRYTGRVSGQDRARLLAWPAFRVVKVKYVSVGDELYGFVHPEIEELWAYPDYTSIAVALSGSNSVEHPEDMPFTPFAPESSFANIRSVLVHPQQSISRQVVDVPLSQDGGESVSLHMKYGAIYEILLFRFGDKAKRMDLFKKI